LSVERHDEATPIVMISDCRPVLDTRNKSINQSRVFRISRAVKALIFNCIINALLMHPASSRGKVRG